MQRFLHNSASIGSVRCAGKNHRTRMNFGSLDDESVQQSQARRDQQWQRLLRHAQSLSPLPDCRIHGLERDGLSSQASLAL
jgi:hypothetical protein